MLQHCHVSKPQNCDRPLSHSGTAALKTKILWLFFPSQAASLSVAQVVLLLPPVLSPLRGDITGVSLLQKQLPQHKYYKRSGRSSFFTQLEHKGRSIITEAPENTDRVIQPVDISEEQAVKELRTTWSTQPHKVMWRWAWSTRQWFW